MLKCAQRVKCASESLIAEKAHVRSDVCRSRSAGTSDEVGSGDCRHVCDDEESHQEDHDEGDHVQEDHDDHCSATGFF